MDKIRATIRATLNTQNTYHAAPRITRIARIRGLL